METIKDFIVSGGVTMVPILMVSVIALGMIFERIYVLSKIKSLAPETLRALIKASENQNFEEIKNQCQNVNHPLGYILRNVFKDGWISLASRQNLMSKEKISRAKKPHQSEEPN